MLMQLSYAGKHHSFLPYLQWALGGRPPPLNTRTGLHNSRITVPFVCTQPMLGAHPA